MKAVTILIFTLWTLLSSGQVITLKIFYIDEKYPIINSFEPYPGQLILDKNKDSCKYFFKNGEFSIFIHNQKSKENNEIILYFALTSIKIKIKYNSLNDTIKLNPLFLISNNMIIKYTWYKNEYKHYKKIYKEKSIEYNKDSTYYCVGRYKGKKYGGNDSYNFDFSENGEWFCYNKTGQLISKMNFINGRFNGNYEIKLNNLSLYIKGKHKDGAMIGNWIYNYDNKIYTWSFIENYMVYDITKKYH
ncbi:MAG: hypothetical protein ACOYLE_01765 [Bacteroidales bacterium]